jgi:hypothetical protein
MTIINSMKKLSALSLTTATYLSTALAVFAQTPRGRSVNIDVTSPDQGIAPGTPLTLIFNNAITIVFIVAALLVLFYLIIGAFRWITAGGDKENTGKARTIITNALIGMAILALAFLIVNVVGGLLGIDILRNIQIPALDTPRVIP